MSREASRGPERDGESVSPSEQAPPTTGERRPSRTGSRTRGRGHGRRSSGGRRVPNLSITQANPLALSRQEMGILTKRLLVLALSDITKDDSELEPIRITAWEYAQLFNIKGKSIYSRIEQSARELLEQTVQIKEPNGDWVMFQWVSEARYENGRDSKEQMACIELKVHEKLKPYLLQLRRDFSIIPTEQLLSFESFNSMRLFEVLYTASYAGERSELVFDIEDLKLRLGLDGKYDRFKDFRYVLDKAQTEFKRYTCLVFSYRAEKVGRKYRRVHFAILKNEVFRPRVRLPASLAKRVKRETDTEQLMRELQARDVLREIGWAQDADRTIQRYGAQRVVDIVAYARKLAGKAEAAVAGGSQECRHLDRRQLPPATPAAGRIGVGGSDRGAARAHPHAHAGDPAPLHPGAHRGRRLAWRPLRKQSYGGHGEPQFRDLPDPPPGRHRVRPQSRFDGRVCRGRSQGDHGRIAREPLNA
jgi:plasmid replication initiation protein